MTERPIIFNGDMVRAILRGNWRESGRIWNPGRPRPEPLNPGRKSEFKLCLRQVLSRRGYRFWIYAGPKACSPHEKWPSVPLP